MSDQTNRFFEADLSFSVANVQTDIEKLLVVNLILFLQSLALFKHSDHVLIDFFIRLD